MLVVCMFVCACVCHFCGSLSFYLPVKVTQTHKFQCLCLSLRTDLCRRVSTSHYSIDTHCLPCGLNSEWFIPRGFQVHLFLLLSASSGSHISLQFAVHFIVSTFIMKQFLKSVSFICQFCNTHTDILRFDDSHSPGQEFVYSFKQLINLSLYDKCKHICKEPVKTI